MISSCGSFVILFPVILSIIFSLSDTAKIPIYRSTYSTFAAQRHWDKQTAQIFDLVLVAYALAE